MTNPRGMIASVGGSPRPIVFSLNSDEPSMILFIVSEGSRPQVERSILPELEYGVPQHEYLQVSNHQDIETCYSEMRDGIAAWLQRREISPDEVRVDYTGGTKVMSAALALSAVEYFSEFKYIASSQRDKDGLGVGESGFEYHARNQNPWHTYAVRDLERANLLLSGSYAQPASLFLRSAAERCAGATKIRLNAFANLAEALAHADRFDFARAENAFDLCRDVLAGSLEDSGYDALTLLETHLRSVHEEVSATPRRTPEGINTILELMANAERRAKQERYDDAAGRLYRAIELRGQQFLKDRFGAELGVVNVNLLQPDKRQAWEANVLDRGLMPYRDDGNYNVAMANLYRTTGRAHIYDNLKDHLISRNHSLFAHGVTPISKRQFTDFWNATLPALQITRYQIPRWPTIKFTL